VTLKLHASCKARLQDLLVSALPRLRIQNGKYIDRASVYNLVAGDSILPQTGNLHEQLLEYISEFPFTDFVHDTLGLELSDVGKYVKDPETMDLSAVEGYSDPAPVATRLIDSFESLPWTYQVSFQLPEQLSGLLPAKLDSYPLSQTVRIARATENFTAEFPLRRSIQVGSYA
jgi:hypothetical protein